jgi:hypothetical protein
MEEGLKLVAQGESQGCQAGSAISLGYLSRASSCQAEFELYTDEK